MQGESSKHFAMYLSLNLLAWLGLVDKCMEKVKLQCIIPSIPEHHQSLAFTVENLWNDILNLQTADLSGMSQPISPIFKMGRFIMCKGLPYYILTLFVCMDLILQKQDSQF